ncbi:hypothetical protein C8J57DRAFT_1629130 [Mycena rebaudengoi]|nr:hypothetical protein C8J57DRAFT_1629130 [Mycena rebaudengoi]
MKTWVNHRQEYLDEMLRAEGRGDACNYDNCRRCGSPNPTFRCEGQLCHGPAMSCKACIVASHAALPTHWVENGVFFERRSLAEIGLKLVVIDTTGVHIVAMQVAHWQQLMRVGWWPATVRDPQTCATFAVMRLFEMMSCLGKINGYDFLRSLELLTNGDGLSPPPSASCLNYIARQIKMLRPMKRAGRCHANSGVRGTVQGELVLRCRACPQPGINMEPNWNLIDWSTLSEDLQYKYTLFLATDCNFRLVNRNVSTEAKDPIVDDGLGFFVNHGDYREFLRDYVSEEEISSCSGFQAMFLANMKRVKGLRTTGVGGVTCARHNMWRPNGLGDLQLGERFCNVDFILLSCLLDTLVEFLMDEAQVWYKVPNFHLPPHKPACHSPFSFHFMRGAGQTHGETVEQNWEFTNGAAASSQMRGPGARAAMLEYLFAFHNWRRTVSYRRVSHKQMAENVREGQKHCEAGEGRAVTERDGGGDREGGHAKYLRDDGP